MCALLSATESFLIIQLGCAKVRNSKILNKVALNNLISCYCKKNTKMCFHCTYQCAGQWPFQLQTTRRNDRQPTKRKKKIQKMISIYALYKTYFQNDLCTQQKVLVTAHRNIHAINHKSYICALY